jgi:hypothetical protein
VGLSLAAPAMLLGLALLALPVAAHLTGYRELRVVDFPALRFLRASQLKVRRRTRVEALLLLALRCLAVALLVLLFARPSLRWTATALGGLEPGVPTLILLDRSGSMSAEGDGGPVFDEARRQALTLLDGLGEGTLAGILEFDAGTRLLEPGMTADHGPLRRALERAEVGAGATDLGGALRRARQVVEDAGLGRANLLVLSDGTAAALPTGLASRWPEGLVVHYHDLLGRPVANRWVDEAAVTLGLERGEGVRVRARVRTNSLESGSVALGLDLGGGVRASADVALSAGEGTATFTVPMPPTGRAAATATLPADDLPLDDAFPFTLAGDSELDVLLVSGDGGQNPRDDEVYYLARALQPGPGTPSRVKPRVVAAEELRHLEGGRGDVVFLANIADPGPLAEDLERFLKAGGGAFLSVGNRVDPERYNDALGDLLPARFTEVKSRGAGTFEQSPTGLAVPPLDQGEFRVFRTGGAGVFSRVRFGRLLGTEPRLQPDSRVLLRTTDGLPALLERRFGAGRLVVFTSTIDDDWTDFPLRSIYPSLVHQFARGLSDTLVLQGGQVVEVGATVRVPVPVAADEPAWVVGPAGDEQPLDRAAVDEEGLVPFAGTERPGPYQVVWAGARGEGTVRSLFSVRVPASESALSPLGRDALLAAVPGLHHHGVGEDRASDAAAEVVRTASLAPWLAGALLLALALEGAVIGRRS